MESLHQGAGQPCLAGVARSPDPLQQLFVGHHQIGIGEWLEEQSILFRGQHDRPSGHCHAALRIVEHQIFQNIVFGLPEISDSGALAQDRPDARTQPRGGEWFHHIVGGP